jgi:hypothetical protein
MQEKSLAKADAARNRLYIKIARKLTKKDLDNLYTDIRFCVADLRPGFNVITDLSECTIAALNGVSTFRKISNFLIENRVGTVVRIMNDDSILFRQFINLTARMQGYKPIIVSTLEEADAKLLELAGRSAPRFCLYNQQVEYNGTDVKGTGILLDISTSGCAITPDTSSPKLDQEISITISFNSQEKLPAEFKATAKVVNVDAVSFAVEYVSLDSEEKEQLWKQLVHESRSELRSS